MFLIYSRFRAGHPEVSISTAYLSCLLVIKKFELFAKGISFVANAVVFTLFFCFPWV